MISFNLPRTEVVSVSVLSGNCPIRDRNGNRYYGFQRVMDYNFVEVICFFYFEITWRMQLKFGLNYYFHKLRHLVVCCNIGKGKSKAVPLQTWSGPEGSRNLRFPDFMTTAQDGDKVVSLKHRPPLPPVNAPGTHLC